MQGLFSSSSVMDEKTELVVSLLDRLWEELERDPILAAANAEQRAEARIAVERAVFSQVRTISFIICIKQRKYMNDKLNGW